MIQWLNLVLIHYSLVLLRFKVLCCLCSFVCRFRWDIKVIFQLIIIKLFENLVYFLIFILFTNVRNDLSLSLLRSWFFIDVMIILIFFDLVEYLINFVHFLLLFDLLLDWNILLCFNFNLFLDLVFLIVTDLCENVLEFLVVFDESIYRCLFVSLLDQLIMEKLQLIKDQISFKLLISICLMLEFILKCRYFLENAIELCRLCNIWIILNL